MTRTAAGDAFTSFVVDVASLGHFLTDAGETLARHADLFARALGGARRRLERATTVAQIARVRGMARQPVQRIADALVEEGLASFKDNPKHRRARLLAPTAPGRRALEAITGRQGGGGRRARNQDRHRETRARAQAHHRDPPADRTATRALGTRTSAASAIGLPAPWFLNCMSPRMPRALRDVYYVRRSVRHHEKRQRS